VNALGNFEEGFVGQNIEVTRSAVKVFPILLCLFPTVELKPSFQTKILDF
jgi:hypothetical protein